MRINHERSKLRIKKTGLPPGTVIFTGDKKVKKVLIHYLQYDQDQLVDKVMDNQAQLSLPDSPDELVDWYDIRGIHDTQLIEYFGKVFHIHPLVLEDIADIYQRPKFEEHEHGIFVIIHALAIDENLRVTTEQVAVYFRKGLIVTCQETASDLFELVRKRVHTGKGRVRSRGADYLAYALLDAVVDHYFVVLDRIEQEIEKLEAEIIDQPSPRVREHIHKLKQELLKVRKSIGPLREAIARMTRCESILITEGTQYFNRDLYDHTIQLLEITESYRDVLNGLQELYISEISFKMNKVMQLLTVISAIFIPLTFLAGIYGMNFENMPELHWKYGYFFVWGLMITLFTGLIIYFKKKKWI